MFRPAGSGGRTGPAGDAPPLPTAATIAPARPARTRRGECDWTLIPGVGPGWDSTDDAPAFTLAAKRDPPPKPAPHPADAPLSLYECAFREAERHKWLESERHGYDVGEGAIRDWYHHRWPHFCRTCQLQHVAGRVRWAEFDPALFASLHEAIASGDVLADRILDRVDAGWENLTILLWAREWGLPMKPVLTILERIDVNRARLDPDRL